MIIPILSVDIEEGVGGFIFDEEGNTRDRNLKDFREIGSE